MNEKPEKDILKQNKVKSKVESAASGNCSHHLLLSWGNFHHRRKIQYIGGLIYGYCLYCCKLFIYGIISMTQRSQLWSKSISNQSQINLKSISLF